jgi:hypothetical protein
VVTDPRGNPIAGAAVVIFTNDSPIDEHKGGGVTDGSGRYSFTSERGTGMQVRKSGYLDFYGSAPLIGPDGTATLNVTLQVAPRAR